MSERGSAERTRGDGTKRARESDGISDGHAEGCFEQMVFSPLLGGVLIVLRSNKISWSTIK